MLADTVLWCFGRVEAWSRRGRVHYAIVGVVMLGLMVAVGLMAATAAIALGVMLVYMDVNSLGDILILTVAIFVVGVAALAWVATDAIAHAQGRVDADGAEITTGRHTVQPAPSPPPSPPPELPGPGQPRCGVCMEARAVFAFVPCGHILLCAKCSGAEFSNCPLCRRHVRELLRVFS